MGWDASSFLCQGWDICCSSLLDKFTWCLEPIFVHCNVFEANWDSYRKDREIWGIISHNEGFCKCCFRLAKGCFLMFLLYGSFLLDAFVVAELICVWSRSYEISHWMWRWRCATLTLGQFLHFWGWQTRCPGLPILFLLIILFFELLSVISLLFVDFISLHFKLWMATVKGSHENWIMVGFGKWNMWTVGQIWHFNEEMKNLFNICYGSITHSLPILS